MEFFLLTSVVLSVGCFGFFFSRQRTGPAWASYVTVVAVITAAVVSAIAEARETSVEHQMAFNIIVFNSFVLGYVIGDTDRKPWHENMAKTVACAILAAIVYLSLNN